MIAPSQTRKVRSSSQSKRSETLIVAPWPKLQPLVEVGITVVVVTLTVVVLDPVSARLLVPVRVKT